MDFMQEAANEALLAMGNCSPNPPVGAIIVSKDNKIIGRGHTQRIGYNHAEIEAINSCSEDLEESTLFTTLEPCNITINTPPCTDQIIKSKITHVVVGAKDINPKINGAGITDLIEGNVKTEISKLNKTVNYTLEAYNHYVKTKTPFLTLKMAMSLDGKIATNTGNSKWISGKESRELVHQYRSNTDAILTGINTVIEDNPTLNVRLKNSRKMYQPKKIIIDTKGKIPLNSNCLDSNCIIITSEMSEKTKNKLIEKSVKIEKVPLNQSGRVDLTFLYEILLKHNLTNILIECGSTLSSELLKLKLIHKILMFISPNIIGGSEHVPFSKIESDKMSDIVNLKSIKHSNVGNDILIKGWF
ncbi:MAG: bifunctional diaminohydroxyphosphoribosylaminopyrimidine deaminase/5-amino-6-(5-phosphoribosylamino)uracil reductase RibD [Dehalococcoidia bacterium]